MDKAKVARLNELRQKQEPFTPEESKEWAALWAEHDKELFASWASDKGRTIRRVVKREPVAPAPPTLAEMEMAAKYPYAEMARRSMAKMKTRLPSDPTPEPGSMAEWSRNRTNVYH